MTSPRESDEGITPKESRDQLKERLRALKRKLDLGKRERESMSEAEHLRRCQRPSERRLEGQVAAPKDRVLRELAE